MFSGNGAFACDDLSCGMLQPLSFPWYQSPQEALL